jgi:HD-GYP domain-containing protein (c-di-GMP phosphodiesterase class II)
MSSVHKNLPLVLDDLRLPAQATAATRLPQRGQLRTYIILARQRLWRGFVEPSSKVTEPDQRRQAILLSGFLLSLILLAIVIEIVTDVLIDWDTYTGYRQTIVAVLALGVVYLISRTERVQFAAILAVIIATTSVFFSAWGEPRGVLGGLFDFLILPLWLGSLFIDLKKLTLLIAAVLAGLLAFPLIAPAITLDEILVGPFTFTFTTSLLLLIITRHRNQLEHDRRSELSIKEMRSRREAARAEALLRIADRLNAQLDQETVLAAVGEEISRALNTTVSIVSLYDREQKHFSVAASLGLAPELLADLPVVPRAIYDRTTAALGKVFTLPDLQSIPNVAFLAPFKKAKLRSIAFASMIYEHQLIGSLSAITIDEQRAFTRDELLLLQGLADQAALALVNTQLYGELSQAYDSTIEGWSHALDLRDKETEGHSQRVTMMTLQLAQAMGFSSSDLIHIRRGALLHDIGKMGVPDGILLKPSALTESEWQIMCQHPQFAYNMLAPIEYLRPALDIPYCHHEKWDGTGYPRGLAGQEIPMAARIFAITDVYDALTSDRPYRKAWSRQRAIEHICSLSGTHFDPQVVEVFSQAMEASSQGT